MKKIFFSLLTICFANFALAQTQLHSGHPIYSLNGNIGIGLSNPLSSLEVRGSSGVYSDFAGYSGTTVNNILPNGKAPSFIISETLSGTLIPATGGQVTYRGGLSFGYGGPGIYSTNPNPVGSDYYGDIRFHTTYWNGSSYSNSDRMVIKTDGSVGIGTTSPGKKLTISRDTESSTGQLELRNVGGISDGKEDGIYFTQTATGATPLGSIRMKYHDNGAPDMAFFTRIYGTNTESEKLTLLNNGNVGIGTPSPSYTLSVKGGPSNAQGINIMDANSRIYFDGRRAMEGHYSIGRLDIGEGFSTTQLFGNIGIGTTSPTEKLEVNGTIRSKKIKVEATGWPDFVFAPNYKLRTLNELEAYIKANQHLPEVPSAKEVEENGLDLGKMDATLLQKVEELTLYTIEQEEKIAQQSKENQNLKSTLETVLQRLEKLESQGMSPVGRTSGAKNN